MKKKTKLKPNIGLLRRIQRAILKKPDQFMMSSLFSSYLDNGEDAGGCGTAGCIAGWALHLTSRNKRLDKTSKTKLDVNRTLEEAGYLIGIKTRTIKYKEMLHPLFFSHQWPEPFRSRYAEATASRQMARVASDRIEHYIKTGE